MYRIDNAQFKTKEAKMLYLLRSVLNDLDYIGKESKLSVTEKAIKKLATRDVRYVVRELAKNL
jgi:hypothetical protein